MEAAGALKEGNLGLKEEEEDRIVEERGESWDPIAAAATQTEKDQKLKESPISPEKCLSQETREPLGPVSHRESL